MGIKINNHIKIKSNKKPSCEIITTPRLVIPFAIKNIKEDDFLKRKMIQVGEDFARSFINGTKKLLGDKEQIHIQFPEKGLSCSLESFTNKIIITGDAYGGDGVINVTILDYNKTAEIYLNSEEMIDTTHGISDVEIKTLIDLMIRIAKDEFIPE